MRESLTATRPPDIRACTGEEWDSQMGKNYIFSNLQQKYSQEKCLDVYK